MVHPSIRASSLSPKKIALELCSKHVFHPLTNTLDVYERILFLFCQLISNDISPIVIQSKRISIQLQKFSTKFRPWLHYFPAKVCRTMMQNENITPVKSKENERNNTTKQEIEELTTKCENSVESESTWTRSLSIHTSQFNKLGQVPFLLVNGRVLSLKLSSTFQRQCLKHLIY